MVTANIHSILDANDKLQNATGTYDTISAYVDDVKRLKQSDRLAKAMDNALAGVAGNSGVDKINDLKTMHNELQTIHETLNMTTLAAASE